MNEIEWMDGWRRLRLDLLAIAHHDAQYSRIENRFFIKWCKWKRIWISVIEWPMAIMANKWEIHICMYMPYLYQFIGYCAGIHEYVDRQPFTDVTGVSCVPMINDDDYRAHDSHKRNLLERRMLCARIHPAPSAADWIRTFDGNCSLNKSDNCLWSASPTIRWRAHGVVLRWIIALFHRRHSPYPQTTRAKKSCERRNGQPHQQQANA